MLKRLNNLSFIIGLFFTLVAVILLAGYALSSRLSSSLNLYTGLIFLVFGGGMILAGSRVNDEKDSTP